MKADTQTIIGLGLVLVVAAFDLRNFRTLRLIGVLVFLIAVVAMAFREPGHPRLNKYDAFLAPGVYVGLFALLRAVYKRIHRTEPTWFPLSWFDPVAGRRQNWMDVITYAVPMMLSMIVPIWITHWLD